jgi:hypothetical protein
MKDRYLNSVFASLRLCVTLLLSSPAVAAPPAKFFETHCTSCHDADSKAGGLDLTALKFNPTDPDNFARWVKVHDRVAAGEMPPKKKPRPSRPSARRPPTGGPDCGG